MEDSREIHEIHIVVFNVGEGDSIAVGFPVNGQRKWGLIDCCKNSDQVEPPVLGFLRREGIKELEFICLTHLHYDHYRGLSKVLEYFENKGYPINSFWRYGVVSPADVCIRMWKQAEKIRSIDDYATKEETSTTEYERQIAIERVIELRRILNWRDRMVRSKRRGDIKFWLKRLHGVSRGFRHYGSDAVFHCLAPVSITEYDCETYLAHTAGDLPEALKEDSRQANLSSTIVMLTFDTANILFGGDAGVEVWNEAIKEAKETEVFGEDEIRAHVVKASHHGSRYSSSVKLWKSILRKDAFVASASACFNFCNSRRGAL